MQMLESDHQARPIEEPGIEIKRNKTPRRVGFEWW
jgi:hypothetical protein